MAHVSARDWDKYESKQNIIFIYYYSIFIKKKKDSEDTDNSGSNAWLIWFINYLNLLIIWIKLFLGN